MPHLLAYCVRDTANRLREDEEACHDRKEDGATAFDAHQFRGLRLGLGYEVSRCWPARKAGDREACGAPTVGEESLPRICPEAQTMDFVPSGYVTIEEAVDKIGRGLMPRDWLGHEVDMLKQDRSVTEAIAVVDHRTAARTAQAKRLGRAVSHLQRVLSDGDVKAVVAHDSGAVRDFPPSFWREPAMRAVFRSGELPAEIRIDLEGPKAGAGKRWIFISEVELRSTLERIAASQVLSDVESEFAVWLSRRIDEAAGQKPPTKKRVWMDAQAAFDSRLSYRIFERVWHATVPETWRRPSRARAAKPTE